MKAYGYGHGPVQVADAALRAGATWLGVALVEEGAHLRAAGQFTEPILLLSEPPYARMDEVVAHGLTPTVYTPAAVEAAAKAVAASARREPLPVHVKVDSGMHRVGANPDDALRARARRRRLARAAARGRLDPPRGGRRARSPVHHHAAAALRRRVDELAEQGVRPPLLHAANSAGALTRPDARYDMVRCGIALYGLAPSPPLDGLVDLRARAGAEGAWSRS